MENDPRFGPGGQSGSSGYSYGSQNGSSSSSAGQSGNGGYHYSYQHGNPPYNNTTGRPTPPGGGQNWQAGPNQGYQGQPGPNPGYQQGQPGPNPGFQGQPGQPGQQPYYQRNQGFRYQYGNGTGTGRGTPKKQKSGWEEWIPLAVLFLLPFAITKVIAVILFFSKIGATMNDSDKKKFSQTARQTASSVKGAFTDMGKDIKDAVNSARPQTPPQQNPAQNPSQGMGTGTARVQLNKQPKAQQAPRQPQPQPRQAPQYTAQTAQRRSRLNRGDAQKRVKGIRAKATAMVAGGGFLSGLFGLATLASMGDWLDYYVSFSYTVLPVLLCLLVTAGGAFLLGKGLGLHKQTDRIVNYLGYIGDNQEIPLANMAASFGVPVKTLCNDLRYMLAKGILPQGYLDLADGKLYLTEGGYQGGQRTAGPAAQPTAPRPEVKQPPKTAKAAEEEEDDILRQIREVNDQIPDASMTAKIDRIEEITRKILAYQKAHPDREAQLRSFLNYYLPTTLKILRAYAQLDAQGIEGENIGMAKKRIEGMMDQVVAGYEKQLDKLFTDDVMDITTDVEVLENMLRKDGLAEDNITLQL